MKTSKKTSQNTNFNLLSSPYNNPSNPDTFPENEISELINRTKNVGVCFSGGGSRALSAAFGQMRGLQTLGLLEKVRFISSVSGGTWASVIYTYFSKNGVSDEDLLGTAVPRPADLTWDGGNTPENLNYLDDNSLGMGPVNFPGSGLSTLALLAAKGIALAYWYDYSWNEVWARLIGNELLKPYDLSAVDNNGNQTSYYNYTEKWIADNILFFNNNLKERDFRLVTRTRPFLITNSSLFLKSDETTLVPYEATAIYAGTPSSFAGQGEDGRDVGGGYIQSYGVESTSHQRINNTNRVKTNIPQKRYSLSDIAGTSSAAFAAILHGAMGSLDEKTFQQAKRELDISEESLNQKLPGDGSLKATLAHPKAQELNLTSLKNLKADPESSKFIVPQYEYWPVLNMDAQKNTAAPYSFGDGGNLENSGIMGLLRRQVPNIISFVNSDIPLCCDNNNEIRVSDMLPPLFGYQPKSCSGCNGCNDCKPYARYPTDPSAPLQNPANAVFGHSKVFDDSLFLPFTRKLWTDFTNNGTVFHLLKKVTILDNDFFGIKSYQANVLFVYNNVVKDWSNDLSQDVKDHMSANPDEFSTFPYYNTFSQLSLTKRQVNLLGHLSCWNVINENNKSIFEEMFQ